MLYQFQDESIFYRPAKKKRSYVVELVSYQEKDSMLDNA
jgi:hypothetical protein